MNNFLIFMFGFFIGIFLMVIFLFSTVKYSLDESIKTLKFTNNIIKELLIKLKI